MDYQGCAVDLSEDFTVAASNVITTLVFGKEVSISVSQMVEKYAFHQSTAELGCCLSWGLGKVTFHVALLKRLRNLCYFGAIRMYYSVIGQCIAMIFSNINLCVF